MLKNDKRIFIGSLLGIFILYNFLLPQTLLFAFDFSAEFRSAGQRARVLAGIERLEMVVPEDTTGTVRLGFARLSSGDSPVEQRTAAAVSERLRQIMPAELPVRSLTVIEQQGIQRRLLKERRQSVINSINDANRKLDELLFAYDLDDKARKNQADDLQQEINLLREKLQTWEEVPLSYINVLTERQTELIELSGQSLFPAYEPVKAFPDKADILIGGSVRTIGGYLEVDIRLYSRFAQDTIPEGESIFRDVIREEDMAEEVAQMAFRTVEAISARPLAMTRFIVEGDDQAVLYIQPERISVAANEYVFLDHGVYNVQAVDSYGKLHDYHFYLAGKQDVRVNVTAEPLRMVDVKSLGVNEAEVFRGAWFEGLTPMSLEGMHVPELIRLQKEGYRERMVPLQPDQDRVSVRFRRDTFALTEEVSAAREDFYTALGLFALSVPVMLISDGVYLQFISMTGTSFMYEAQKDLYTWGTAAIYARAASRVTTFTLGFNAALKMIRYIRFAQAEHTGSY